MGASQSTHDNEKPKVEILKSDMKNVLLLGLRESGKSTIIKQLQFLTQNGLPSNQRAIYMYHIKVYIIGYMQNLLTKDSSLSGKAVKNVVQLQKYSAQLNAETCNDLLDIWNNKSSEIIRTEQLMSSAFSYFMNKLPEISAINEYEPTDEDILMLHLQHSVAANFEMMTNKMYLNFLEYRGDALGANIKGSLCGYSRILYSVIIFVVDISAFDVKVESRGISTKLKKSWDLFKNLCKEEKWKKVPLILFFNKMDIFRQKFNNEHLEMLVAGFVRGIEDEIEVIVPWDIHKICVDYYGSMYDIGSIKDTFKDYDGDEKSADECYEFVSNKFIDHIYAKRYNREIAVINGVAIDRSMVEYLLGCVQRRIE